MAPLRLPLACSHRSLVRAGKTTAAASRALCVSVPTVGGSGGFSVRPLLPRSQGRGIFLREVVAWI